VGSPRVSSAAPRHGSPNSLGLKLARAAFYIPEACSTAPTLNPASPSGEPERSGAVTLSPPSIQRLRTRRCNFAVQTGPVPGPAGVGTLTPPSIQRLRAKWRCNFCHSRQSDGPDWSGRVWTVCIRRLLRSYRRLNLQPLHRILHRLLHRNMKRRSHRQTGY